MDKRKHLQKNGAGVTDVNMQKNANRTISITVHKSQSQVDQRPQHKIRYIEPDRRESEE